MPINTTPGRKSEVRNPSISAGLYDANAPAVAAFALKPSAFSLQPSAVAAFTLIELLIVIAIIAILAAMVIPITGAVNRNKIKAKARVELERIATSIDLYKAKLGHYPPDAPGSPATNQLYFELLGTIFTNGTYVTLDGSAQAKVSTLQTVFGPSKVGGIINTTQGASGDEGRTASSFLNGLKPDEVATITSPDVVKILVAGVPAPAGQLNTFNYVSSNPTNNPNSYDLWVDLVISGKTNRISNWTKEIVTVP